MQAQSLTLAVIESVKSGTGSWQAPHCSDICRNSLHHPPPPTPSMGICQSISGAQLQQGMWRISPPLCPPNHHLSPLFHLHPPTLPERGPNHGISLNNMVYVCNRAAGVRLVSAVHLCYFRLGDAKEGETKL